MNILNPCFYYYLQKPQESAKLLTAQSKHTGKGFNISLQQQEPNQSKHVWMFKSADLDDIYYIYHCLSGLVLELGKQNNIEMHHFKGKDAQKFKVNLVSGEREEYVISEYMKGAVLFTKSEQLVCDTSGELHVTWTIRRALKNKIIHDSAILEFESSGAVLEASDNAQKQLAPLQQNDWTGMFAQRWFLEPYKEFYFIRNVKSCFVITIKNKKAKESAELIQEREHENEHKYQLWSIEERGHRVYSIRLASEQMFFMGIKNYWKGGSPALLVSTENRNFWRITASHKL